MSRSASKSHVLLLTLLVAGMLAAALPASASPAAARDCAAALGSNPVDASAALDTRLEIISWNMQKASRPGWADDLAQLAGNASLAFLQEALVQASIPDVLATPVHQAFAAGYTTAEQQTGVMTLSTAVPSLRCALSAREPWLGTPKATSVTEYPIRGRSERLLAINLHAVNFTLGIDDFRGQLLQLEELLANHPGPVVVAGDFNTWSSSRQALVDTFLHDHALRGVNFTPDLRTTVFGSALDHIYIRGLRAEGAQVVPVSSSDHNPLRVVLEIL
jgi:endonuclease/exonuclease/phosphatase (EEP) superfamily protein YafD